MYNVSLLEFLKTVTVLGRNLEIEGRRDMMKKSPTRIEIDVETTHFHDDIIRSHDA